MHQTGGETVCFQNSCANRTTLLPSRPLGDCIAGLASNQATRPTQRTDNAAVGPEAANQTGARWRRRTEGAWRRAANRGDGGLRVESGGGGG